MKEVQAEIIAMGREDQRIREGMNWNQMSDEEGELLRSVGQKHVSRLKVIVDEYGCMRLSAFGKEASTYAWLIVQHAGPDELEFMIRYRDLMEDNRDDVDMGHWAYLVDRIRNYQGMPQLYGTQIEWDEEGRRWRANDLEDEAGVDARRNQVGLEPLAEYLKGVEL